MPTFPEPTDPFTSPTEMLLGYLDFFRERAVEKVEGLPDGEATTSRLPSAWTPLELLVHLTHVERRWLEWGFLGDDVGDPWGDERDGRWHVPDGLGVVEVVAALRAQGVRTRQLALAHRLDALGAPGPRWRGADPTTLERVLLHLVQEWARHLGQLDVVAELAGGEPGE